MTAPMFLAEAGELTDAAPDAVLTLTGPEARHAVSVQRLRAGEEVFLTDGRGRRVTGTVVEAAGKDLLRVRVVGVLDEPAPATSLVLVQALAKGGRDEQAVETAVEVGVTAVVPWRAQRCVSVWEGAKVAKGRERWQATSRAAAKQSRRAWVPPVEELHTTAHLARWVTEQTVAGTRVLVLHESATTPLPLADLAGAAQVAVIVGPEGGIDDAELERLTAAGAQVVRLGPHVMRTSTAGPIALALVAHASGSWD